MIVKFLNNDWVSVDRQSIIENQRSGSIVFFSPNATYGTLKMRAHGVTFRNTCVLNMYAFYVILQYSFYILYIPETKKTHVNNALLTRYERVINSFPARFITAKT